MCVLLMMQLLTMQLCGVKAKPQAITSHGWSGKKASQTKWIPEPNPHAQHLLVDASQTCIASSCAQSTS